MYLLVSDNKKKKKKKKTMNIKQIKYRIKPEKSSENSAKSFNLIFKIVEQKDIPSKIKLKNLFPNYILEKNIDKARKRFVNSFFFPISKENWRILYNMKSVEYGRNFYKGTEQMGTKSISVRDRRYKKGYRTERHAKWGKVFKHHLFIPWTNLSNQTILTLNEEFDLIIENAKRNQKIGRIVIPLLILILTVFIGAKNGLIGLIGIILFFIAIARYLVNKKKIEKKSIALSKEIEEAYLSQDEYLINRFLPYSEIKYKNLEEINTVANNL